MRLLLLSSSRVNNSAYLEPYLIWIKQALQGIENVLFIPYAGVSVSYDDYLQKVQQALTPVGINITSVHQHSDQQQAVRNAEAICVGGGNTFHLLYQLYQRGLVDTITERVASGIPYLGWSAGSNIAGQTICTTNDMPIIQPASFNAFGFLPLQLNPHYSNVEVEGFHGETRDMRLAEYMQLNPAQPIIGLPEGTALQRTGNSLMLLGAGGGYLFRGGNKTMVPELGDLTDMLT